VIDRVRGILQRFVDAHGGLAFFAPLDIVFSEYDVVQPDVVFFNAARKGLIDWNKPIREAPDLVVEVLSRGTESNDRGRKLRLFLRYGVPEYWILDPDEHTVEVRLLRGDSYVVAPIARCAERVVSATLPGLACEVSKIFVDC
jgi:Uma2 family endonuclease